MTLPTWILSLLAEWLRPVQPDDPVLAPLPPAIREADERADRLDDVTLTRAGFDDDLARDIARDMDWINGGSAPTGAADPGRPGPGSPGPERYDPERYDPEGFGPDSAGPDSPGPDTPGRGSTGPGAATSGASGEHAGDTGIPGSAPDAIDAPFPPQDAMGASDATAASVSAPAAAGASGPGAAVVRDVVEVAIVTDREIGNGLAMANPFWRLAGRLVDTVAPGSSRTSVDFGRWLVIVVGPAVGLVILLAMLESLGLAGDAIQVLVGAAVLYFTVPLGRLWRRLDRLSLLAAAGENAGFRYVASRWYVDDWPGRAAASGAPHRRGPAPVAAASAGGAGVASVTADGLDPDAGPADARAGFVEPLIDAYRDVFAPLFWFVIIGPAGPLGYALARFIADGRRGFARSALYWIDWLPLRLASASFAFGGRFDDAMLGLRAAIAAARFDRIEIQVDRDPTFPQTLFLLPTAAGATGIRLAGPALARRLAQLDPDHEEPERLPTIANFGALRSLLGRTALIWLGLWVLLALAY